MTISSRDLQQHARESFALGCRQQTHSILKACQRDGVELQPPQVGFDAPPLALRQRELTLDGRYRHIKFGLDDLAALSSHREGGLKHQQCGGIGCTGSTRSMFR